VKDPKEYGASEEHRGTEIESSPGGAGPGGVSSAERRPKHHADIVDGVEQSHTDGPCSWFQDASGYAEDWTGSQAAKHPKQNERRNHLNGPRRNHH
jgi:hypothetical protein